MTTDIFEDFDEESQELLERLQENMLDFKEIGQVQRQQHVQARNRGNSTDIPKKRWGASPNMNNFDGSEPNLCGAFEADFDTRGINYERLARDLKDNIYSLNGFYFDYRMYALDDISSHTTFSSPTTMIPTTSYSSSKNNMPFDYSDEAGNSKKGIFNMGRLNKRICYIDAYNVGINFDNKNVNYSISFPYKDAEGKELVFDESTPQEDFFRKDKYVAIQISDTNVEVFLGFIKTVFGDGSVNGCKTIIVSYFNNFFLKYNTDVDRLKLLYEQAPDFVLSELLGLLGKDTLWNHFTLLSDYDDKGFFSNFKDASSAFINVLKAFGNSALLYDKLKNDPVLIKRIYKNLDKSSDYMGQVLSNRIIFSYLLNALCVANGFKDLTVLDKTFYYGEGYKFDANVTGVSEKDDEFFIQQLREIPLFGMDFTPFTEDIEEDKGKMYHPLDMVSFVDKNSPEEFVMLVPAILIKALSDEEEWQEINKNIRIGFDILALIIGVITVATTGNPGLFALALADIALATTDITVQTFHDEIIQMEGGPEFIDAWEKIYLVGGIITAGPALISTILKSGTSLLRIAQAAKNFKVMNYVKTCMMKVILEINIANFTKNTVKEIIYGEEALKLTGVNFKIAEVSRLQQEGVLFIKGINSQGETVGLAALYKGEVIAQGTAKEVRETLKDIWTAKGANLVSKLESLLNKTKVDFDFFLNSVPELLTNRELAKKTYALFRNKNWDELERLFAEQNLNGGWPPNRGGFNMEAVVLEPDFVFDRYGGWFDEGVFYDKGNFVSPKGTGFKSRALPLSIKSKPFRKYVVLKPIPDVKKAAIIPWFKQKGLGIQYELPATINELEKNGYIKFIK